MSTEPTAVTPRTVSTPKWAPVVANLVMGLFAVVPIYCAYWLATRLAPMDCRDISDMYETPPPTNCDFHVLDHYPIFQAGLLLTGTILLVLILLIDVFLPLVTKRNPLAWLVWTPLIAIPYALLALVFASASAP